MNQCNCEPFENASVDASVPGFSCLLTSSGPFFIPYKSTFYVFFYTTRWNDQGQAFFAVTSCTDAHISSNNLVCTAGEGGGGIPQCTQYLLAGREKRFSLTLKPHSSHRSKLNLTIRLQVDFKNNAREQV